MIYSFADGCIECADPNNIVTAVLAGSWMKMNMQIFQRTCLVASCCFPPVGGFRVHPPSAGRWCGPTLTGSFTVRPPREGGLGPNLTADGPPRTGVHWGLLQPRPVWIERRTSWSRASDFRTWWTHKQFFWVSHTSLATTGPVTSWSDGTARCSAVIGTTTGVYSVGTGHLGFPISLCSCTAPLSKRLKIYVGVLRRQPARLRLP
jgi:hypothetical protein